jgi:hypothetical protein
MQAFGEITARSSNCTSPAQLRQTTPQLAVVGLFRDLRGIAAATATRRWVLIGYKVTFDLQNILAAVRLDVSKPLRWVLCWRPLLTLCLSPSFASQVNKNKQCNILHLTCRTYSLLFDWMYPGHFRAVLCCLEAFADSMVTVPTGIYTDSTSNNVTCYV